jgi:hypothetical protein
LATIRTAQSACTGMFTGGVNPLGPEENLLAGVATGGSGTIALALGAARVAFEAEDKEGLARALAGVPVSRRRLLADMFLLACKQNRAAIAQYCAWLGPVPYARGLAATTSPDIALWLLRIPGLRFPPGTALGLVAALVAPPHSVSVPWLLHRGALPVVLSAPATAPHDDAVAKVLAGVGSAHVSVLVAYMLAAAESARGVNGPGPGVVGPAAARAVATAASWTRCRLAWVAAVAAVAAPAAAS